MNNIKSSILLKVVMALLAILIVFVAVFFAFKLFPSKPANTNTETTKSTQSKVDGAASFDSSEITISVNTSPVFPKGTEEGNINIICPISNKYDEKVEIYSEDNVLLYQSNFIKPGEEIGNVKLLKTLAKGEYKATAYFMAYTNDTHDYLGKAAAKISINVLN